MLPSMWRTELLHPLVVHFPIALLIFGSLFYILSLFRFKLLSHLQFSGVLLITVGTVFAWAANITGGLAEEIVGSQLCDPDIRMLHEDYAYYVAYIFTIFVFLEIARRFISRKVGIILLTLNVTLCLSGSALLGYVGHLGATLTYQQAAGVYNPGPQCIGY